MKIPKKVNIIGYEYKIVIDNHQEERHSLWGQCDNGQLKIFLKDTLISNEIIARNLFHEISHAIDFCLKIKDNGEVLSESEIERLATGLQSLIRDNNWSKNKKEG
jgi:hypothetical protein